MVVGAAVVPPRASGPRRYKALAPWRFQPGFVREQVKHAAAAAPRGGGGAVVGNSGVEACGFGTAGTGGKSGGGREDCQLKRCTRSASVERSEAEKMENSGGRRVSGNDGDLGKPGSHGGAEGPVLEGLGSGGDGGVGIAAGEDCGLEGSIGITTDTHVQNFGSGDAIGAADGTACNTGIGSHVGAEKCISEGSNKSCPSGSGLKSNGLSAADCMSEKPEENGGSTGNEAAKESDVAAKGCNVAGPGSNGNGTNCRKGRKVVAPWRFQVGYKRSFSKAFCCNSGPLKTPEYRVQGNSTQCTSATTSTVRCYASAYSSVRVSAMRDFSSVKGEKEISAYKKRKTENDGHNQGMPNNGGPFARERVVRSLLDFRLIYRKLVDEKEHWSREVAHDLQAYKIFRERFCAECDDNKYVGSVPGIIVGDIFHMRVELCVVGLHRPHRIGVDHIKEEDGTCIAVSIVSYAQSSDVKNNLDVLVYSGSMTATVNQKIEGTNLALKKSMDTKTPVRVIHGFSTSGNSQRKKSRTYIYGGLYVVEKYWREKESEDRYVYMFRLRRMAGQKHIDIKETLKSGQVESYDSIIMKDLSQGLERIPISVVNSISDEYPMPYRYISGLQYRRNYQPAPPAGCACVDGCSDSKNCACAVKNGGEIPFNDKGRIIVAKPLVYECGPSCKCPPTCHNRVGQKGIKFRLQVFKTKLMGWGVKTLDFIPSGSFVCEYIGEVLDDEEAQKRTTDEYLFAIGHNYYDEALWEGLPRSIPSLQKGPGKDEETGFAVDASKMGNFAKFINHNCTPNLYAQNVLYDHDDKSVPHVMFFASENIHPYQELAYHYNYTIDQVHDVNGNIKKKKCLCGSIECDGWLY